MACDTRDICIRCKLEKLKVVMTHYALGWLCHKCEWILEQIVDAEGKG